MPRHKHVTVCRKSGGAISTSCTCEHCALHVCAVCGAWEASLTTDCPEQRVDFDRQQEVHETNLDFTDERGWHLGEPRRFPRFEDKKWSPEPPRIDQRSVVAPATDWAAVDRTADLQHQLTQKAIAWVLADRTCEDHSAAILYLEEKASPLHGKTNLDESDRELLAQIERANIDFRIADKCVQKCDDELRQTARKIVAALEQRAVVTIVTTDKS